MYGLPKTHKEGTPLRFIMSMTGLSHYELGRWLAGLLQSVLERFSSHCISDSFTFTKTMLNLDIDPNVFVCSFDVSSLFTNVHLDETIKIYSEALYDISNLQPVIPKNGFVELMKSATSSIEFSFNNIMYKQTDGVAMGSPLSSALADIFVKYYAEKLLSETRKPPIYFRYVDDTFAIFDHKPGEDEFLTNRNHIIYPTNLLLKKRNTNNYRFLMSMSKEQILDLKPVYIGNPLLLASIYVGIPLVLSNVKYV